jgi:8-oxo-dGTP pyrophosphatase MutT (NUDIX family)
MKFVEKIYNHDNLNPEEIDEKTTRVRAVLINSCKKVLMCYSNGLQHYEFPGGHLEKNETLEDGLKREILEETGITIDKEKINPFYAIKYYCKNYHDSSKNRLVEIYYYVIYCDSLYYDSKKNLDTNEIIQNYECQYINVDDLKNILIGNKKTTKENNSALDDMILIWDEFLKEYRD